MTARFVVTGAEIAGVYVVERQRIGDTRGYLERLFCENELLAVGWEKPIAQINHTYTMRKGTVRGMHYQSPPHAEMKLVLCVKGEVFDVALDVRAGSPTFLHWHGETLSEGNRRALLIPEGCAHGFQALTNDVEMLYLHSAKYAPQAEGGISPLEPKLAIDWPLAVCEMSGRDEGHPELNDRFIGVRL